MKDFDIFEIVRVARDSFKQSIDEARKTYDESMAGLKNYVKGTDFYKEEQNRIPTEFEEKRAKASKNVKKELETYLVKENEELLNHVSDFRNSSFLELSGIIGTLKNTTVTPEEVQVLADKYANKSYWCDKLLKEFCEENEVLNIPIMPDYATQLSILDQLEEKALYYFENYDGTNDSFEVFESMHDSKLNKLQSAYVNGFVKENLSMERQSSMALSKVKGAGNKLKSMQLLSNLLNTSNEELKKEVLFDIANDEKLTDMATLELNFGRELDSFKASQDYKVIKNSREQKQKDLKDRIQKGSTIDDLVVKSEDLKAQYNALSQREQEEILLRGRIDGRLKNNKMELIEEDFKYIQSEEFKNKVEKEKETAKMVETQLNNTISI